MAVAIRKCEVAHTCVNEEHARLTNNVALRRETTRRDTRHSCPTPGTRFQRIPLFLKTSRASAFPAATLFPAESRSTLGCWELYVFVRPKKYGREPPPRLPALPLERDHCPCSCCQQCVQHVGCGGKNS
jgi:hypothetical protein